MFARQIGMLGNDRPIDEPDFYFWATAGAFHQRCELDQFQRGHVVFSSLDSRPPRHYDFREKRLTAGAIAG
ncbi:MAG: hypothetical protein USCGTAYLOR_02622 [Chromatiales bacterium USCg_Taylor]|nr:MAG: hypothetical protein USCGTAYLOR_02622 [Chromatiales bacterium USCg_Taylor]